jgi:hypothetical protein
MVSFDPASAAAGSRQTIRATEHERTFIASRPGAHLPRIVRRGVLVRPMSALRLFG